MTEYKKLKIVYICFNCNNEIIRPIQEGEIIMLGKVDCDKCHKWIWNFKVLED